jgi:hypothetical protein
LSRPWVVFLEFLSETKVERGAPPRKHPKAQVWFVGRFRRAVRTPSSGIRQFRTAACSTSAAIGTDGRIGFHAVYDSASDRESGVGNTLVGTYLTKIGLPYEAVTYITQATSNEMTWLNMSDAAQRGIRVTLLSSLAKETVAAIPTRYGDVTVTRDDPECHIRYGNQRVEIASTGQIYASLEG